MKGQRREKLKTKNQTTQKQRNATNLEEITMGNREKYMAIRRTQTTKQLEDSSLRLNNKGTTSNLEITSDRNNSEDEIRHGLIQPSIKIQQHTQKLWNRKTEIGGWK